MSRAHNETDREQYDRDLHPNDHAGEHRGVEETRSAHDVKELNNLLHDFPNNELKQILVLLPGARLEEGAIYLDLMRRERGEFTGMNNMTVESGQYLVPKSQTDFELWNRLCNNISPSYRLGRLSTEADREQSDPNA